MKKKNNELPYLLNAYFKVADASSDDPLERELFIVHGDSAAGCLKQGRNKLFQAVLSLPDHLVHINNDSPDPHAYKKEPNTVTIPEFLGCGIQSNCEPENLRFARIVILPNDSSDGVLTCSFLLKTFFEYFRPLVLANKVYLGSAPLYMVVWPEASDERDASEYGDERKYLFANNADDLYRKLVKYTSCDRRLTRFSGVGEMHPSIIWHTALNPATRSLTPVTADTERLVYEGRFNHYSGPPDWSIYEQD